MSPLTFSSFQFVQQQLVHQQQQHAAAAAAAAGALPAGSAAEEGSLLAEQHRHEPREGLSGTARVALDSFKVQAEASGSGDGGVAEYALLFAAQVVRVIGKGSFGKVFLVREKVTKQIYAMKVRSW